MTKKSEWRLIEKLTNGERYQRFIRGKPTRDFMLELRAGDPIIDLQVDASANDGQRFTGGYGFGILNADHITGYATNANYLYCNHWVRWAGITLPVAPSVAYMQVYSIGSSGTPVLKVWGVDEDNPPAPTSAAEYDADPITAAGVDWDGAFTPNAWNQSPSLVDIFTELVGKYTIDNDAVMLHISHDGDTSLTRWNYIAEWDKTTDPTHTWGAKLHLEYTIPGGARSQGYIIG